jgi:uncharacterized cysteine cluster protein YcgN (CxxCxxCC family)
MSDTGDNQWGAKKYGRSCRERVGLGAIVYEQKSWLLSFKATGTSSKKLSTVVGRTEKGCLSCVCKGKATGKDWARSEATATEGLVSTGAIAVRPATTWTRAESESKQSGLLLEPSVDGGFRNISVNRQQTIIGEIRGDLPSGFIGNTVGRKLYSVPLRVNIFHVLYSGQGDLYLCRFCRQAKAKWIFFMCYILNRETCICVDYVDRQKPSEYFSCVIFWTGRPVLVSIVSTGKSQVNIFHVLCSGQGDLYLCRLCRQAKAKWIFFMCYVLGRETCTCVDCVDRRKPSEYFLCVIFWTGKPADVSIVFDNLRA